VFEYIFLRLFGYNLGRRVRNTPDEACDDAVRLLGIFTALPVVVLEGVLAVAFPQLSRLVQARHPAILIAMVVALIPGAVWANFKFSSYGARANEALRFSSGTERLKTTIAVYVVPIGALLVVGLLLRFATINTHHA
jgi:hypothetical protein